MKKRESSSVYDASGYLVMHAGSVPLRTTIFPESFYQDIDRGIRFAIRVLHAHGLETCQSCQGGKGHSYLEPSVEMGAGADDAYGFEALAALQAFGLPVSTVGIIWNIKNGVPYEKNWRITFFRTMEDRADEKPNFFWGYQAQ